MAVGVYNVEEPSDDALRVRASGNLIYVIKKWVVENYGETRYEAVCARTSPAVREVLTGIVLSGSRYPLAAYQSLLRGLELETSTEEMLASAEVQARRQLGFFGIVARVVSRALLIQSMDFMWRRMFTEGSIVLLSDTPEEAAVAVREFPLNDAHRAHLGRYIAALLEVAEGAPFTCESVVTSTETQYWLRRAPRTPIE